MENMAIRLSELRQEKSKRNKRKVTQSDVAKYLGVTPQAVQKWENGNGAPRKGIHLQKLAEFLETTPQYILFGDEETSSFGKVPLLDELQIQQETQEGSVEPKTFKAYFPKQAHSEKSFVYKLKGDAMLPELREGDYILIDPELDPIPGKVVLVKYLDNVYLRKYRLVGMGEGDQSVYEVVPLNSFYPILRSDREVLDIIGVAVEYCRKI